MIIFQKIRSVEELILQRCNNMRVFFIESLRIFTQFEKNPNKVVSNRQGLIYGYLRGLLTLEMRRLNKIEDLAEGDDYEKKGFIIDYGAEFKNRFGYIGEDLLRDFDVKPYKTMPFK